LHHKNGRRDGEKWKEKLRTLYEIIFMCKMNTVNRKTINYIYKNNVLFGAKCVVSVVTLP
jgi:hypothetical protein